MSDRERKRYMLFSFDEFYPAGGQDQVEGMFDTAEQAKLFVRTQRLHYDYYQILDMDEGVWYELSV